MGECWREGEGITCWGTKRRKAGGGNEKEESWRGSSNTSKASNPGGVMAGGQCHFPTNPCSASLSFSLSPAPPLFFFPSSNLKSIIISLTLLPSLRSSLVFQQDFDTRNSVQHGACSTHLQLLSPRSKNWSGPLNS